MDAERWLTGELASFACAACGEAYGEAHIRLIAQRDELFFVDLSCDHCGSQAVAIVTIQVEDDVRTIETGDLVLAEAGDTSGLPDVSRDEPGRAVTGPAAPVTADDVLDAHELLADFEGDAHQLIARLDGEGR